MVGLASKTFCNGDMMRMQIINGSLYVQHMAEKGLGGFWPAAEEPGPFFAVLCMSLLQQITTWRQTNITGHDAWCLTCGPGSGEGCTRNGMRDKHKSAKMFTACLQESLCHILTSFS